MSVPDDEKRADAIEPEKFSVRKWRRGARLTTRSVLVFGRPDLLGRIEAVDIEIVRAHAMKSENNSTTNRERLTALEATREALAQQMAATAQVWQFRGFGTGEQEAIRAEHGQEDADDAVTDLDYKMWAAQCIAPEGVTWEDLKEFHVGYGQPGDEDYAEGAGAYFMQTIARTANLAATAGGVDVPFSPTSSQLIESLLGN